MVNVPEMREVQGARWYTRRSSMREAEGGIENAKDDCWGASLDRDGDWASTRSEPGMTISQRRPLPGGMPLVCQAYWNV